MNGRLWLNPEKLFDVFIQCSYNPKGKDVTILHHYPANGTEELLLQIPKFAYPCQYEGQSVEHYTFVLTDIEAKLQFGFCRLSSDQHLITCVVSRLPWFDAFYKLLNKVADYISCDGNADRLLQALLMKKVPGPRETCIAVSSDSKEFTFEAPDVDKLPAIPLNRNLTEYYSAVSYEVMIDLFANMLNERRVIITSKKLSRLTACCHASASLLYPLYWQHLFIPVLPEIILEYVLAPMPYIVGVHSSLMDKVRSMELGDVIILDADTGQLEASHDDRPFLPSDTVSALRKVLKDETKMQGDTLSRAFLRCLVNIIGGYCDGLKYGDDAVTFDNELFISSQTGSLKACLEAMQQQQTFQQFIEDRLILLNSGKGFDDQFETEITLLHDHTSASKYKDWLSSMKKQGKKLKKHGHHTFTKVKDVTKTAYKEVKMKLDEKLKKDYSTVDKGNASMVVPNTHQRSSSLKVSSRLAPATVQMRPHRANFQRPNLQERIHQKAESSLSPTVRRSSYNRAVRYNTLSFDDDDLLGGFKSDLMNDPDLQTFLNRSSSAGKLTELSSDVESIDQIFQEEHALDKSAGGLLQVPIDPIPPPRKKKGHSHNVDGLAPETGFEDDFVTKTASDSSPTSQTKNRGSDLHEDLLGLDLSTNSSQPTFTISAPKPPAWTSSPLLFGSSTYTNPATYYLPVSSDVHSAPNTNPFLSNAYHTPSQTLTGLVFETPAVTKTLRNGSTELPRVPARPAFPPKSKVNAQATPDPFSDLVQWDKKL